MSRAAAKRKALRDVTDPSIESPSEDMRLALPAAAKKTRAAAAVAAATPGAENQNVDEHMLSFDQYDAPAESPPAVSASPPSPDDEGFARPLAPKRLHRKPQVSEEILRMQEEQNRLILRVPFVRQVRTITGQLAGVNKHGDPRLCWHIEALNALHEAAESYLVEVFEDANTAATHARRMTVSCADMQLAIRLRGQPNRYM